MVMERGFWLQEKNGEKPKKYKSVRGVEPTTIAFIRGGGKHLNVGTQGLVTMTQFWGGEAEGGDVVR